MKVVKFGGSSVSNADQIIKVINIVKSDVSRRVIVVSAPGKRFSDDQKVTDLLIEIAYCVVDENDYFEPLQKVIDRFRDIQEQLELSSAVIADIQADLHHRIEQFFGDKNKFLDLMKAAGEDNNAKIIAEAFKKFGCNAKYINPSDAGLLLSDEFGDAKVLDESFDRLSKLKNYEEIIVFPGFFGYTIKGELATFPRGGSDITGAILAAALNAEIYENFTDVDSVYAMDPRIVKNPPEIREMTYREMRELAYAGFGVFHDEAIIPAIRENIPISIKNTNFPKMNGTMILPKRNIDGNEIAGISSSNGFTGLYIDKYMMNREIGFGRKLLQILEEEGISYEHSPSGIDNMSVILKSSLFDKKEKIIIDRIKDELNPDAINIEHDLALLMVVGEGMCYSIGMAAQATQALANARINIEMINQGASEISMMFAVKKEDRKNALYALGEVFFSS